jgi:hypothetical protein
MERFIFTLRSWNRKTGPIPCSYTHRNTCPTACPLMYSGCYAELGPASLHWRKTGTPHALTLAQFCASVRSIPRNHLWRHNVAGDLPGEGDALDIAALEQITAANVGRRGFTFTHKPLRSRAERNAIKYANEDGFTVNLSADTPAEADELAALEIAPVVMVAPKDAPNTWTTPEGRTVTRCPAEYKNTTCWQCERCADPDRKTIIAFNVHGTASRKAAAAIAALQTKTGEPTP